VTPAFGLQISRDEQADENRLDQRQAAGQEPNRGEKGEKTGGQKRTPGMALGERVEEDHGEASRPLRDEKRAHLGALHDDVEPGYQERIEGEPAGEEGVEVVFGDDPVDVLVDPRVGLGQHPIHMAVIELGEVPPRDAERAAGEQGQEHPQPPRAGEKRCAKRPGMAPGPTLVVQTKGWW
jgi:hypothetical protein